SVSRIFDGYRSEVYRQYIECRFRSSLGDACDARSKGISRFGGHKFHHQSPCFRSAYSCPDGLWQRLYKRSVEAKFGDDKRNTLYKVVHSPRSSKDSYSHEDSYQVGDDIHRNGKTFCSTFYKGVIYINFFVKG